MDPQTDERPGNYRFLIGGLILVLAGVLVALVQGVARDTIVIPILYAFLYAQQIFESIPQLILWILVVVVVLILALRSLVGRPTLFLGSRQERTNYGRVETWMRLVDFAGQDEYSRWRLAQRLGLLTSEVVAHQEQVDLRQTRQVIEDQTVPMPPEVRAYLRAGIAGHRPRARGFFGLMRSGSSSDALELDPAKVADFLEQRSV